MIPEKDIYDVIESQKDVQHLRISDFAGRKLFDIDTSSNTAAVNDLRAKKDFISHYGKVIIQGANSGQKTAHYKGCCTWYVDYGKPAQTAGGIMQAQNNDPWAQMASMMQCMKMMREMNEPQGMAGYVHPDVVKAQLAAEKMKGELELEKTKLQLLNDDPIKKYGSLAPMVLSMCGKSPDEIKSMISMSAMMHNSLNNGNLNMAAGNPNITTNLQTDFNNLQQVPEQEKNERIQKALNSLAGKISAEDMVILTESLDSNPDYAQQAVIMLKQAAASKKSAEEKKPS